MNLEISHHLLLCATSKKGLCCDPSTGNKSWERLKTILRELDLENPHRREGIVLRSKVDCLRTCKKGPILLIWPDGIWYEEVSPHRIELIVRKNIVEGLPLKEGIIKETRFNH